MSTVPLVGGEDGVFQMRRPGAAGASWASISSGLPKGVLSYDLRYKYTQNVLTVGTLGRGVWSLTNFFRGGGGSGVPAAARGPVGGPAGLHRRPGRTGRPAHPPAGPQARRPVVGRPDPALRGRPAYLSEAGSHRHVAVGQHSLA